MLRLGISIDEEIDGDDTWHTVKLLFIVDNHHFGTFSIWEPKMFSAQKYTDLVNNILTNLTYCDSNGEVSITNDTQTGIVHFRIGKHGAGGDGEMHIEIKHEHCKAAFEEFAKWRSTV
jgi:hypothetical protein